MKPSTFTLVKTAISADHTISPAVRARVLRALMDKPGEQDGSPAITAVDAYLSPKAAAAYISLSKRTLARYVKSGRLVPHRLNRRVIRFRRRDLDAFFAGSDFVRSPAPAVRK